MAYINIAMAGDPDDPLLTLFLISSCQTTYYSVWEKPGKEKRHLLKENVEKARQDQVDASEQFNR